MTTDEHLYHISRLLEEVVSHMREDKFMSFAEAADYCGVSVRTIKSWRERGYIRTVTHGRKKGVMRSDLKPMRKDSDNF